MNCAKNIIWLAALGLLSLSTPLFAKETPAPAATNQTIQSVFEIPNSPKDGRDPFFPESSRMAEAHAAASAAAASRNVAEVTALKVPGISGTPGHLLAIINNHTFAVGDEGDVTTSTGRIHLRCVDIQHDSVTVEVNGRTHKIKVESQAPVLQINQTP